MLGRFIHLKDRERVSYVDHKGEVKMSRRRDPTVEYVPPAVVTTSDRPRESRKEQVSGYPAAGEGKQNNGHFPFSQDMETSTGEVISPSGIRLWGMW